MVALIEAAQAARAEAERLRGDERELRAAMRASAAIRASRLEEAAAAAAAAKALHRSRRTQPSPWSTLEWLYEDAHLEGVLVPVG